MTIKHASFLLATLLSLSPAFAEDPPTWGQRLADSTIAEHPQAWSMRKSLTRLLDPLPRLVRHGPGR